MENWRREIVLGVVCMGLWGMIAACGISERNSSYKDAENHTSSNAEDSSNGSLEENMGNHTENDAGNGLEDHTGKESGKNEGGDLEESGSEDEYGIATLPLVITMTVTDISDGVATAVINNQSGQEIMYGEDYYLMKKIDGKWQDLPFVENIGFNCVGIYLPDLEQHTVTCDLNVFGELEEGEYMLIKEEGIQAEFSLDGEGNLK